MDTFVQSHQYGFNTDNMDIMFAWTRTSISPWNKEQSDFFSDECKRYWIVPVTVTFLAVTFRVHGVFQGSVARRRSRFFPFLSTIYALLPIVIMIIIRRSTMPSTKHNKQAISCDIKNLGNTHQQIPHLFSFQKLLLETYGSINTLIMVYYCQL